jgi:hypothetical protein
VTAVEGRLQKLETEGAVAHTMIDAYEPSVCLIHVVLAFRDHDTRLKLHYAAITSTGEPETDKSNNPLVSLTGTGREVRLDVFGTGFLATDDGQILTNHHVAEPWWKNDELREMLDQGLDPETVEMTAYSPASPMASRSQSKRSLPLQMSQSLRETLQGWASGISHWPMVIIGLSVAVRSCCSAIPPA